MKNSCKKAWIYQEFVVSLGSGGRVIRLATKPDKKIKG
jgi:hypothetical protein